MISIHYETYLACMPWVVPLITQMPRPDDIEHQVVSTSINEGVYAESSAPGAALLRSNNPELQPKPSSSLSPADLTWLRALLASREKNLAQYQYEVPEEFFPTEIRTPYGVVQDNHKVREGRTSPACAMVIDKHCRAEVLK